MTEHQEKRSEMRRKFSLLSVVLVFANLVSSCGPSEKQGDPGPDDVVGRYRLHVGSEQGPHAANHREELTVNSDGTFVQEVLSSNPPKQVRGRWRLDGNRIVLQNWQDYLSTPRTPSLTSSPQVYVYRDGSVMFLLNPDGNTFYDKPKIEK